MPAAGGEEQERGKQRVRERESGRREIKSLKFIKFAVALPVASCHSISKNSSGSSSPILSGLLNVNACFDFQ